MDAPVTPNGFTPEARERFIESVTTDLISNGFDTARAADLAVRLEDDFDKRIRYGETIVIKRGDQCILCDKNFSELINDLADMFVQSGLGTEEAKNKAEQIILDQASKAHNEALKDKAYMARLLFNIIRDPLVNNFHMENVDERVWEIANKGAELLSRNDH